MKIQNILIAHPSSAKDMSTIKAFFEALKIKFEITDASEYNTEFVKKIEKSRKQAKEGKTVKIDLDDVWS